MVTRQPKPYLITLSTILIAVILALALNTTLMTPPADGSAPVTFHSPRALASPDGQALFEQKCQSCHTIGDGRLVGPDLKDITSLREEAWLIRTITNPDRLIAEGDPIAKQLVSEYGLPMPNVGISDEEAQSILAYIETQAGENKHAASTPAVTMVTISTSAATGKDLFTGRLPFKNGGPSCLTCHNISGLGVIGGGAVGKELTGRYATFGETGLTSVLKTPPFPMMREIYTAKPLHDDEIAGLVTFLKEVGTDKQAGSGQNPVIFFVISAALALLVIIVFQFLWRGRLSGVRRSLVKGGSK
ncbi:MAG: cytochrome c [Dehalococcoidales bacterium]|nr:cytochrome c [Dehalococcoidales bacterium]